MNLVNGQPADPFAERQRVRKYRGDVTVTVNEVGSTPYTKTCSIEYKAGDVEPDRNKVIRKILKIAQIEIVQQKENHKEEGKNVFL